MLLAGVDIETTGLYMNRGHRLIQIGISVLDTELGTIHDFVTDVRPVGRVEYDDRAMKINGFTKARIKKAPSQDAADTQIWGELLRLYRADSIIPVGSNVINFDMAFIKKELPLVATMFMYPNDDHGIRAIDLIPLGLFHELKTGIPYEAIKREYKDYAAHALGYREEHDALYDAKAALQILNYFKEKLGANI